MDKIPVSCCLIVKDDASTLETCLRSVRPYVDEIVVVDTGSQDGTLDVANRYADKVEVYTACNGPDGLINSFAEARNHSFSLASHQWAVWFDGDDEVFGLENLQQIISKYSEDASKYPVSIEFPYEYAHDEHGNQTLVHYRERLISNRRDFEWRDDVHEVLCAKFGAVTRKEDSVKVVHRRQFSTKKTESGRNLRILRRMYENSGDTNTRTLYYLGMECINNGFQDEGIKHLSRHVELSGWPDEQYMSCLLIIGVYKNRAQYEKAIEWCQRAILIREDWGEAYFEMAKCFYFLAQNGKDTRRNWERCVHFSRVGLNFPPTKTSLFINPLERSFEIHKYLNVALNSIGLVQDAKESSDCALKVKYDEGLLANRNLYGSWLIRQKIDNTLDELSGYNGLSPSALETVKSIIHTNSVEPKIIQSSHSSEPQLPENRLVTDYPPHFSRGTQLSMFQGLWKTLLLHDEIFAARHLMQAVPWAIRDTPEIAEMWAKTNAILAPHNSEEAFKGHYSFSESGPVVVETIPMPNPVPAGHDHLPRWEWLLEVVNERESDLGRKLDILDIGSADGWLTNRIAQNGHSVWGIDTRVSSVNLAKTRATQFSTGATHEVHDFMSDSPVPDGFPSHYDIVVLYEVYEHLHDPVKAFCRVREILKPGGQLLISTPRGSWGQGVTRPGHYLWNDEYFREHIRAAIPSDLERDYASAGMHGFDSRVVEHTSGYVPGQAALLTRGGLPSKIDHVRSPLDIVLYVGWNTEPWNPEIAAKTGIGGSETAAMEMARLLTARGNKVRLYGECNGLEGTFSGVEYLHYSKFSNISCDALVVSRRPQAIDAPGLSRKATLCWVHDIHCGSELTHERALKIDKFLCLSNWHKGFFFSQYDFLHPSQVAVTRNGIDLSRFNRSVPRNPHRAVYSSSPDRGLETALRCWPQVRQAVPDAELHIYYGFQTWEACVQHDDGQKALIRHLKDMISENAKHGVYFHGRVDQATLAREYLASGVWTYPSWFSETSCISAMEAHAAGLRMITSPIAALNETVGNRGVMVHGDWLSAGYQTKFVEEVIKAMNKPDDGDRNVLQSFAHDNFSWDGVAKDWDAMLRQTISDVQSSPIVQYRGAF